MKNQLHGVTDIAQHSSQRVRGVNTNVKSVEPSLEIRSPLKVEKSSSHRKQIIISSVNYQPLPSREKPTQKVVKETVQGHPYKQRSDIVAPFLHLTPLGNHLVNQINSNLIERRNGMQKSQQPSSQPSSKLRHNAPQVISSHQHQYFNVQPHQPHSSMARREVEQIVDPSHL